MTSKPAGWQKDALGSTTGFACVTPTVKHTLHVRLRDMVWEGKYSRTCFRNINDKSHLLGKIFLI